MKIPNDVPCTFVSADQLTYADVIWLEDHLYRIVSIHPNIDRAGQPREEQTLLLAPWNWNGWQFDHSPEARAALTVNTRDRLWRVNR